MIAALLAAAPAWAATTQLISTRVWPAIEYTRVTFEAANAIQYTVFTLKNPERVVLDLEQMDGTGVLADLADKIGGNDPYVQSVRVGRFKPGVLRLAFDVKTEVKPQAFTLKPVPGYYGYRLVLDIYPAVPVDPLAALLEKTEADARARAAPTPAPPAPRAEVAPAAAPPAARAEPEKAAPQVQRLITIAIDAGHGGEDPGAKGRRGTFEKNVTLAIARKLKARVDQEQSMRAVLVRDGDYFIPLHHRVEKARKVHADLFVSVHADAFIKPRARGSSVFALSERGATSSTAKWLAKRENEADLIGGVNLDVQDPYLKLTLADLSFTAQINDSLKVARTVLASLGEINALHKADVEQAGFAVLKAPDTPSILIETAFISNPEEEKKLKNEAYQEKMADAILAGIKRYFAQNPPLARSRFALNP